MREFGITRIGKENGFLTAALVCLAVMLTACCSSPHPAPASNAAPLTVKNIGDHRVVGLLGLPLGTVTEVRATIVAGHDLGTKETDGLYLLRVTEAGGHPLAEPQVFEFSVLRQYDVFKIAPNADGSYRMTGGGGGGSFTPAENLRAERDAVGKPLVLSVWETGEFSGIPANLPRGTPMWQDHSFGFSTDLVVLPEE